MYLSISVLDYTFCLSFSAMKGFRYVMTSVFCDFSVITIFSMCDGKSILQFRYYINTSANSYITVLDYIQIKYIGEILTKYSFAICIKLSILLFMLHTITIGDCVFIQFCYYKK